MLGGLVAGWGPGVARAADPPGVTARKHGPDKPAPRTSTAKPDNQEEETAVEVVPPPPVDVFTKAVERAVTLYRMNNAAGARRALMDAVDEARARAPLEVHTGVILSEPPENLGMYKPAPGSMVFGHSLLLYAEVDNHGFRKRAEGYEIDLWTDVFLLYEDGERIGGKEHFGEHRMVSRTPHRTTFLLLEVNTSQLPAQPYLIEVVVHDAVSGKTGSLKVPFRVAARPGHLGNPR